MEHVIGHLRLTNVPLLMLLSDTGIRWYKRGGFYNNIWGIILLGAAISTVPVTLFWGEIDWTASNFSGAIRCLTTITYTHEKKKIHTPDAKTIFSAGKNLLSKLLRQDKSLYFHMNFGRFTGKSMSFLRIFVG